MVDLNQEKPIVTLNINGLLTLKGRDYQNESKGKAQSYHGKRHTLHIKTQIGGYVPYLKERHSIQTINIRK